MRKLVYLPLLGALASCGSFTLPASVQLADGTVMVGTTTAAMSGGTFEVATPDKSVTCSGTYDALDMTPTISVPVTCTNGLYGTAVVTRDPSGTSGSGYVNVSDGTVGRVAFGNKSGAILNTAKPTSYTATGQFPPAPTTISSASGSYTLSASRTYHRGQRGGCYYINSNGNKTYVDRGLCGGDSTTIFAAPSYSSGRVYVRGHYRNGRYVRGHYRRR